MPNVDFTADQAAAAQTPAGKAKAASQQAQQAMTAGAPVTPYVPTAEDLTLAAQKATPQLTPQEATTLGLSASDVGVPVSAETTGHVKPTKSDQPDEAAPASSIAPTPMPIKPIGPAVTKEGPSTKDIVTKIITGEAPARAANEEPPTKDDFLKTAAGKLGDFLQRWGMGLQGAPTGATQGDIQRQQAFELQKQQAQAQVAAKQMALENQYQTQRMQLQNQMNVANIPIEAKAQLQNRIAELDAEYQNQLRLLPLQLQQQMAMRQWLPGAAPEAHILDQGK